MAVVWVTRTAGAADKTAEAVRALGHEAVVAPVLEVHPIAANLRAIVFDAVIFTSANAVTAYAGIDPRRDVTAWCVGGATAEAARNHGFARVISADGDVRALFDKIRLEAARTTRFLYAAPREPAAPLTAWMWAEGLMISQIAVYETRSIVPDIAPDDLGRVTHVLIHSAKAAQGLSAFLTNGKVAFTNLCFICISEAVWQAFETGKENNRPAAFSHRISPFPDEASMLKQIET